MGKYIGSWRLLDFGNAVPTRARIVGIEFHQQLRKPVFHFMSSYGNPFTLTREELKDHELTR